LLSRRMEIKDPKIKQAFTTISLLFLRSVPKVFCSLEAIYKDHFAV